MSYISVQILNEEFPRVDIPQFVADVDFDAYQLINIL